MSAINQKVRDLNLPVQAQRWTDGEIDAIDRMNRALEEALRMPPKPHKGEPKRGKGYRDKRNVNDAKA